MSDRDRDRKRRDYYDDDRYDKRTKVDELHSRRNEPAKEDLPHDFTEVNWRDHQSYVDGIFFKKSDLIRKGSPEYEEFWDFLDKFIQFKRVKLQRAKTTEPPPDTVDKELAAKLGIPTTYNERYQMNFTIIADQPKYARRGVTAEDLTEFHRVIHLYHNFCQKRTFQKLIKIKEEKLQLPIAKYKEDLLQKVNDNNVILVAGDTGCGKSTQVVQYLVEAGYQKIACTQPRRIATMSLAKRVAYETLNEYGSEIGYQIRFESSRSSSTKILFLTEGLLLRQLSTDPLLKQYNVLLLDEVHERHIHTDFLLAILRELIKKRTDLKLILMSATINIELFSDYFNKPPIIMVPGRLYPIQVEYHPIEEDREPVLEKDKNENKEDKDSNKRKILGKRRLDPKPFLRVIERIDQQFPPTERGDLLIFLSGIEEIMALAEELKEYAKQTKRWAILMLHSSLSLEQQDKVFDISPDGVRKCILSTNIAETSVTIQGIRFVIDSGKVKEIGYDAESKLQRLQEFWISKASAEQRKGRAGRTGPGHCFRLYSPLEYEQFIDYSTPEIQRIPLESIILQIKTLHFGDPRHFPFIESPAMDTIEASVKNLKLHDALSAVDEEITPLGQVLASLPVDIPVGKILILATLFDLVEPVLTIAAAISVQSPFVRNTSDEILNARNSFISEHGDPFTLYNVFCDWIKIKYQSSENSRKWCRRHGVEEQRLYEVSKLRSQFKQLLRDSHLLSSPSEDSDKEFNQDIFAQKHKKYEIQYKRRELKKLQQDRDKNRSRKVLQIEDAEVRDAFEEEEHLEQLDLRDVDFRLSHNIQELLEECESTLSRAEISTIKYILSSGFYPNIAYPDEFNPSHKEAEQVYHSLFKTFASLHPTSIFYGRSVLIQPNDLLAYEKLLETNKPYLTNVFRVPALQMLLLTAQSIDTNQDCSRLVIDDWISIRFNSTSNAEKVLVFVHELRLLIRNLLRKRLKAADTSISDLQTKNIDFESIQAPAFIMQMINDNILSGTVCTSSELLGIVHSFKMADFLEKFSRFIETPIGYTMERVKQSEILDQFRKLGEDIVLDKDNPMAQLEATRLVKDIEKGGVQVCSYLRFNSLLSEAEMPLTRGMSKHLKKKYKCEQCNKDFMFNLDEVELHVQSHK